MKRFFIIIAFVSCCLTSMRAQQAGDIISGQVVDAFGPVMMANVVEIDAANRIVAAGTTDMNGNFSFKIKNPKDRLKISYVGYKTQTLPINKTYYKITMTDETTIKEVTVTAKRRAQGSGLSVPVKEVSTAGVRGPGHHNRRRGPAGTYCRS